MASKWRFVVAAAALVATFVWLDLPTVLARLADARPAPLVLGLVLTLLNTVVLGVRWHFTATRLGLPLSVRAATREYFMSLFLNLLVPGGVVGDIARVFRQRDARPETLTLALQSVVLERTAGQIALGSTLVLGAFAWGTKAMAGALLLLQAAFVVVVLGLAIMLAWVARTRLGLAHVPWRAAMRSAWLGWALPVQLALSFGSLFLLIVIFWACACAVGSPLTLPQALVLVPWLLAATTIPITVGGWGVRELVAASLFSWAAFDPTRGTAASLAFGFVTLVGTLPGAWFLAHRPHAGSASGQSNSTS